MKRKDGTVRIQLDLHPEYKLLYPILRESRIGSFTELVRRLVANWAQRHRAWIDERYTHAMRCFDYQATETDLFPDGNLKPDPTVSVFKDTDPT